MATQETIGYSSAAQRLGISIADVTVLVEQKKIKEDTKGRIILDSVYAYSGLKKEGKQTGAGQSTPTKRGRKPALVSDVEAKETIGCDEKELLRLVQEEKIRTTEDEQGQEMLYKTDVAKVAAYYHDAKEEGNAQKQTKKAEPAEKKQKDSHDTQASSSGDATKDTQNSAESTPTAPKEEQNETEAEEERGRADHAPTPEPTAGDAEAFSSFEKTLQEIAKDFATTHKRKVEKKKLSTLLEAVDEAAYMRGKLEVYESMESFERRIS